MNSVLIAKHKFLLQSWHLPSYVMIVNLNAYLSKNWKFTWESSTMHGIDAETIIKDVNLQRDNFFLHYPFRRSCRTSWRCRYFSRRKFLASSSRFILWPTYLLCQKSIRRLLAQSFWGYKRPQNWKGQGKSENKYSFLFLFWMKKDYSLFVYKLKASEGC